jgi:predicted DCC family thiol-disulfide oxidoreductase YuxK
VGRSSTARLNATLLTCLVPQRTRRRHDAEGVTHQLTVLYDADCGVCRLTVLALRRLDWGRRLDLVPLQSFAAEPAAEGPSHEDLLSALHVRDASGRWATGGAAALRVARVIPVLAPLAIAGRLPGMGRVAERAYRLVADHRHAISRVLDLDRCALELRSDLGARDAEPRPG